MKPPSPAASDPTAAGGTPLADLLEEITDAIEAGEAVDIEAFVRRAPQHAEQIRSLLPTLMALDDLNLSAVPSAADAAVPATLAGSATRAASAVSAPWHDRRGGDVAEARGVLGDFRILREVGRGGMGIVYEAEQLSLGRRVALKVLPLAGMLDRRRLQRFQNEARAAAGLHHPHIVPVHSVGCERGVHYYAMQFIEGQSLADVFAALRRRSGDAAREPTEADRRAEQLVDGSLLKGSLQTTAGDARRNEPGTSDPLRTGTAAASAETAAAARAEASVDTRRESAFSDAASTRGQPYYRTVAQLGAQAADALEYAHSLGVVHRDIKPANLLLDEQGKVWVADFGLAQIESEAGLTATGDVLGTVRYMSPEQAMGRSGGVDHRTDIYSLGITLYELVTLRAAFGSSDRRQVLRQVLEDDPPPPRHIDAAIPRDLETILLKAISKEPRSRYATAQELADDLQRFLQDRPIHARRLTLWERGAKCVRRHRRVALAMVALLLLAVVALATTTGLVLHAKHETEQALQEADNQRRDAERAAGEKQAVLSFVVDELLGSAAPEKALGRKLTVEQVLDTAETAIDRSFGDQPLIEAAVRHTLGVTNHQLGTLESAERHLQRAVALRGDSLGEDHPETLESLSALAQVLMDRGDFRQARALYARELEARRRTVGDQHRATLNCMGNLAWAIHRLGDDPEARALLREVAEAKRRNYGEEDPDTLGSMSSLGLVLARYGDVQEGRSMLERVVEIRSRLLGPEHPDTLSAITNLADIVSQLGELIKAETLQRQVLERQRRVLGEEHPGTLTSANNLAASLAELGKLRDARRHYEQVLEVRRRTLGEGHPATLTSMFNMGRHLETLGRPAEARVLLEEALEGSRQQFGEEHPETLRVAYALAGVLYDLGSQQQARALYERLANAERELFAGDDLNSLESIQRMHEHALAVERHPADWGGAMELHRRILDAKRRLLGDSHPATFESMHDLAWMLKRHANVAESIKLCRQSLETARRNFGEEHPVTLDAMHNLGSFLPALRQWSEARQLLEQAIELRRRILGDDHPDTLRSKHQLARILHGLEKSAEARTLQQSVVQSMRRVRGDLHLETISAVANLAGFHLALGELNEAQVLVRGLFETKADEVDDEDDDAVFAVRRIAQILRNLGLHDEVCAVYRRILQKRQQDFGEDHERTLAARKLLAAALRGGRDFEKAHVLYEKNLQARQRNSGIEDKRTLGAALALATSFASCGSPAEARPLLEHVLEGKRRALGEDHPDSDLTRKVLFNVLQQLGDYAAARKLGKQTLSALRSRWGEQHQQTSNAMWQLAAMHELLGEYQESISLYRELLAIRRDAHGNDHHVTLEAKMYLAVALNMAGRHAEALELYEEVSTSCLRPGDMASGSMRHTAARAMRNAAKTHRLLGNDNEAVALYRQILEAERQVEDQRGHGLLAAMSELANALAGCGEHEESSALYRQLFEMQLCLRGEAYISRALEGLAKSLADAGEDAELAALHDQAFEMQRRVRKAEDYNNIGGAIRILMHLARAGEWEKVSPELEACLEILDRIATDDGSDIDETMLLRSLTENISEIATMPGMPVAVLSHCLELAERAVELNRTSADAWRSLGLVQYRLENYPASVESLTRSSGFESPLPISPYGRVARLTNQAAAERSPERTYWLLAMAHWRLGDEEESRRWSKRAMAIKPRAEFAVEGKNLAEIRAEAMDLLGFLHR